MKKQTTTIFDVKVSAEKVGASLKIARQRRGMTQGEVALRIGVGREVVLNAEKGKSIASHSMFSLLWLYGLLGQMVASVADDKDIVGMSREKSMLPLRVRKKVDDDEF